MSVRTMGVGLLILSVTSSVLFLSGQLHPTALRWMAHGGAERIVAIVFGSLTFKAALFMAGALMAFWPERHNPQS